jgi:hypothetical protein
MSVPPLLRSRHRGQLSLIALFQSLPVEVNDLGHWQYNYFPRTRRIGHENPRNRKKIPRRSTSSNTGELPAAMSLSVHDLWKSDLSRLHASFTSLYRIEIRLLLAAK